MSKKICVEIDEVFYESCRKASRFIGCGDVAIKNRCLSDKFPNYQIVPFRITYTEKRCPKCGKVKLLKEFKKAEGKDGFRPECKQCQKEYQKEWEKDNPDYYKIHYQDNKIHISKRNKNWKKENKNKTNTNRRKKRKTDLALKINENISNGIRSSLNGLKHGAHWETLVDYDLEELMVHLESKFTEGMSWDNYGKGKCKWNIDHVIAKCHFNITSNTCREFRDCWGLNNLQPLWDVRNMEKGDKPMEPKYLIKPF